MPKKRLCVVNAPPFGGKSTIIKHLASFEVECVDMSKLIAAKARKDHAFAQWAKDMMIRGQLLPCATVLEIFNDHILDTGHDKYVIVGIPRTTVQSEGLILHPVLADFHDTRVIDVSVSENVLRQRFEERKRKENRPDDCLETFKTRVRNFHKDRDSIMNTFHRHPSWQVRCLNGDAYDSAKTFAEQLVGTMKLKPKP